ncbi:MAG: hypothetical protein Q8Q39_01885 [bacterium]|nr:hypothetical protein [bacterium]
MANRPPGITIDRFQQLLREICDQETSQDPEHWKPENPLWGHCAVASLVAQNLFGGDIFRASMQRRGKVFGSHYWNRLQDGKDYDFTRDQFGGTLPTLLDPALRDRASILYPKPDDPDERKQLFVGTRNRYKLLAWRLLQKLYGINAAGRQNPLFSDTRYRACFEVAMDSPCQKMKFGCVITREGSILYAGSNNTIEPLRSLCDPTCIRLSIQSRTDSMIGACGHGEELALWEVARKGIRLDECELYVAGFHPTSLPWLKTDGEHTCLRCSVQMFNARLRTIYVPLQAPDTFNTAVWHPLSAEEALRGAVAYALKEKTIK